VVEIENGGVYKAYDMQDVQNAKTINDQFNNKSVVLFSLYPLMVRVFVNRIADRSGLTKNKHFGMEIKIAIRTPHITGMSSSSN
jgi:hypothetical protein